MTYRLIPDDDQVSGRFARPRRVRHLHWINHLMTSIASLATSTDGHRVAPLLAKPVAAVEARGLLLIGLVLASLTKQNVYGLLFGSAPSSRVLKSDATFHRNGHKPRLME
jgi:hypothetical protein